MRYDDAHRSVMGSGPFLWGIRDKCTWNLVRTVGFHTRLHTHIGLRVAESGAGQDAGGRYRSDMPLEDRTYPAG